MKSRPRGERKKAEADGAEDVRTVSQDFEERKKALEALHRHTHSAALQLAALRHQAQALDQEMQQARREASQEAEQLGKFAGRPRRRGKGCGRRWAVWRR